MDNLPRADEFQVNVKTLKNIAAVACVAALAVPAGVSAKGPDGDHGKSGKQHTVSPKCKKQQMVGYIVKGTLDASSTATNIVVNVTKVNSGSKQFKVTFPRPQYTVPAGSNVVYEGANPFTTEGADLTKYTVQIKGKAPKSKKGCTPDNSKEPTVKKVQIKAPEAAEQEATKEDAPAGS